MNHPDTRTDQEAEAVWNATRPALLRRRRTRRALKAGASLAAVSALALLWSLPSGDTSPPRPTTTTATVLPSPVEESSLAVLVVDDRGARFEEMSPDQAAGVGLQLELTLAPVFTGYQASY